MKRYFAHDPLDRLAAVEDTLTQSVYYWYDVVKAVREAGFENVHVIERGGKGKFWTIFGDLPK